MTLLPDTEEFVVVRRPPVTLVCRPADRDRFVDGGLLDHDEPSLWKVGLSGGYAGRGPCAVLELPGDRRQIVFKQLRHGGLFGALLGSLHLGMARPIRELLLVEHLCREGVRAPEVVFVRSRRLFGPVNRLWIATRNIPAARDLAAVFIAGDGRRGVFEQAGRQVRAMHDAGVVHADLNLRNILVAPAEHRGGPSSRLAVWVIDLDRSRRVGQLTDRQRVANLERLWRSAVKNGLNHLPGSSRAVGCFMRGYAGVTWRPTARQVALAFARSAWRHRIAWWLAGRGAVSRQGPRAPSR